VSFNPLASGSIAMFKFQRFRESPNTQRRLSFARARFEFLESRSMLSLLPIAGDFLPVEDIVEVGRPIRGGDSVELHMPEVDFLPAPADDELWIPLPEGPAWPTAPYDPAPVEGVPDDGKLDEAGDNEGGMVDLGDFGNPTSGTPFDAPAPAADAREARAVLEMLSSLQYSLSENDGAIATSDDDRSEPQAVNRPLENIHRDRDQFYDRLTEEGAVTLIFADSELDESTSIEAREAIESLHDVSVVIESAAGRFQAFEVLTVDETAPPARVKPSDDGLLPPSMTGRGEEVSLTTGAKSVLRELSGAESNSGSMAFGFSYRQEPEAAFAVASDERDSSTWPASISLVALGIAWHLRQERRLDRLRRRTMLVWRHLRHSYLRVRPRSLPV
jgi:hypothetical protein